MESLLDLFNNDIDAVGVLSKIEESENGNAFEPLLKNVFKLTGDEGSVLMRILPPMKTFKNNTVPFQEVKRHFIKIEDVVYDSICAGWFGDNCAVCEFARENKINYNNSDSPYKPYYKGDFKAKIPRLQVTEETWVNVYIVSDKADPKNNGKIFQYKLPYSIKNALKEVYRGNADLKIKPNDPSNLMTGQSLYIKYQIGSNKFRNYDGSMFLAPSVAVDDKDQPLVKNEEFLAQIKDGLIQDLYDLVDPETRLYTKEESHDKFSTIKMLIDKQIYGDSDAKNSSDRLSSAFDAPPTKKDTKLSDADYEELTKGNSSTSKPSKVSTSAKSVDDELADLEDILNDEKAVEKEKVDVMDDLDSILAGLELDED